MAPTITSAMIYSNEHLTLTNKLRKPVVEKLRRDQSLNQQPDFKMEKADILEMTVWLVRRQQQNQPVSSSSCSAAIVHFLSKDEVKTQSQRRLLSRFQSLHPSSDKNRRESDLPQFSSQPSTLRVGLPWRNVLLTI
uniref:BHLH domain-containing protein n=1 Tax=Salmo trutta TaxID=8032 RepID=A0A673W5J4_SALTR